jgi:hypothetical protein
MRDVTGPLCFPFLEKTMKIFTSNVYSTCKENLKQTKEKMQSRKVNL